MLSCLLDLYGWNYEHNTLYIIFHILKNVLMEENIFIACNKCKI